MFANALLFDRRLQTREPCAYREFANISKIKKAFQVKSVSVKYTRSERSGQGDQSLELANTQADAGVPDKPSISIARSGRLKTGTRLDKTVPRKVARNRRETCPMATGYPKGIAKIIDTCFRGAREEEDTRVRFDSRFTLQILHHVRE